MENSVLLQTAATKMSIQSRRDPWPESHSCWRNLQSVNMKKFPLPAKPSWKFTSRALNRGSQRENLLDCIYVHFKSAHTTGLCLGRRAEWTVEKRAGVSLEGSSPLGRGPRLGEGTWGLALGSGFTWEVYLKFHALW